MPVSMPTLPHDFLTAWAGLGLPELAFELFSLFIDAEEIPAADLRRIIADSFKTRPASGGEAAELTGFDHPEVTPVQRIVRNPDLVSASASDSSASNASASNASASNSASTSNNNENASATGLYVLELWHGPTLAFKDIALQFLGSLFEYFLARKSVRERITVVGATSGDVCEQL